MALIDQFGGGGWRSPSRRLHLGGHSGAASSSYALVPLRTIQYAAKMLRGRHGKPSNEFRSIVARRFTFSTANASRDRMRRWPPAANSCMSPSRIHRATRWN